MPIKGKRTDTESQGLSCQVIYSYAVLLLVWLLGEVSLCRGTSRLINVFFRYDFHSLMRGMRYLWRVGIMRGQVDNKVWYKIHSMWPYLLCDELLCFEEFFSFYLKIINKNVPHFAGRLKRKERFAMQSTFKEKCRFIIIKTRIFSKLISKNKNIKHLC